MQATKRGIEKVHKELNIQARLIICALRNMQAEVNDK
jgi:hypothetical protein